MNLIKQLVNSILYHNENIKSIHIYVHTYYSRVYWPHLIFLGQLQTFGIISLICDILLQKSSKLLYQPQGSVICLLGAAMFGYRNRGKPCQVSWAWEPAEKTRLATLKVILVFVSVYRVRPDRLAPTFTGLYHITKKYDMAS